MLRGRVVLDLSELRRVGPCVVTRTLIGGRLRFAAWERAPMDRVTHAALHRFGGFWYGRIGSRIGGESGDMTYREAQCQLAWRMILDAFPEAATGRADTAGHVDVVVSAAGAVA